MLYYFQRNKLCRHLLAGGALLAAGLVTFSCSDSYDLDDRQPTGLNSLYGYIESQGNCNTYLQLIKDMGLDDVLSKTGSMTMFVADDDAFAEFFKSNKWGVSSYSDLSLAQKKTLLNCSMIGNPLTTTMLSNATANGDGAPTRGEVMRRKSQLDILDSVLVIPDAANTDVLPDNEFLVSFKRDHAGKPIVLFTDSIDPAPMVHFTAKYITSNKIEYSDIDFIMNDPDKTLASHPSEFLIVNGARVNDISKDINIFCKNGFVHKVNKVIMPLDNMAEIIRNDENSSIYSSILERFASVKYDKLLTDRYNYSYGTDYDSVYVKRYFSTRSAGSKASGSDADHPFKTDINGRTCTGSLKFDPAWNSYVPALFSDRDPMMEDFAVMLVPTNDAMEKWWNDGGGKVIKDFYGTLENTPLSTLEKLVNVNMIESFNSAVPSRFNSVLNDANERLGLSADSIDHVTLGCNGVIYHTTTVYAPASYSSVLFPAIVDTAQFNIINQAIHQLDYDKYLNSMVSKYSFFLPTNNALSQFVDPCSYALGSNAGRMLEFKYDEKKKNIHAEIFKCDLVGGKWVKGESTGNYIGGKPGSAIGCKGQSNNTNGDWYMTNRMEEVLNSCTVIEPMMVGKTYYKTKGNSFVKVLGYTSDDATEDQLKASMNVYGSGQAETESPLGVTQVYKMNNGQTFVVDNGAVSGTQKSVAGTLAEIPEFNEFYRVLLLSGAVMKKNTKDGQYSASSNDNTGNLLVIKTYGDVGAEDIPTGKTNKDAKATYLLNNYHYTVYAPTNAAMQKAYDLGLPSPDQIEAWEKEATDADAAQKQHLDSLVACKKEALLDFVKYHIQDNSVFMDEGFETGNYESAKTELIQAQDDNGNPTDQWTPGRPYKINVSSVSANVMTVKDNIGETHNVVPELSNIMAREYWIAKLDGNGLPQTTTDKDMQSPETLGIASSSFVVIQGIDGPLVYDYDPNDLVNHNQFEYRYRKIYQEKN